MPVQTLPNGLKLGCNPSPPGTLAIRPNLGYYLRDVAPAPETCQRTVGFRNWGMKLNNTYGCCVVSGWAHAKQSMSFVDGEVLNDIPDAEVRRVYLQLSPGDNGLNIDEFIDWCENQPMPWTGGPHGVIDPRDVETQKKALWWLGGLKLGIGVPDQWGNNPQNGFVWGPVGRFRGVCHDVQAIDYTSQGLEIITWGLRGTITWAGLAEQCGEVHAVLAPDWYGADNKAPPGLDRDGLAKYLAYLTGQGPMPPSPPNPPGPTPIPPGPGPTPPVPGPDCCDLVRRGLAVVQQGMKLGANDPRVITALDWAEKYLA